VTGLGWDGKTVTVTGSRFVKDTFRYKSGDPVIGDDGEALYNNVWEIKGVTEDSENERTEKYSIGKANVPAEDGESFGREDGKPAFFHPNSKAAVFSAALKDAGFDTSKLVVPDVGIKASNLVGAMITFKATPQLDKDGKPKEDKNGFAKVDQLPAEFVGYKEGVSAPGGTDEITSEAQDLVVTLLTEAEGNTLTRVQLIKAIGEKLADDPNKGRITSLAVSAKFNEDSPWKVDGTTISL
jgi:hypothetical protein